MKFWKVTVTGGVVLAAYDNPPMNYMVAPATAELAELIAGWAAPEVRTIVLTGAVPGRFITHYSVEELLELARDAAMVARLQAATGSPYHALLQSLHDLGKPVIAAIAGDCMGGGLELAMSCDIRIAQRGDFRLGLPETRLGIIPGGSGTQMLARLVGLGRATEMILRGRLLTPSAALEIGLVSEVADDAVARATAIAHELARRSPAALGAALRAVRAGVERPAADGLEAEAREFATVLGTEGAARFMADYVAQALPARRDWLETTD